MLDVVKVWRDLRAAPPLALGYARFSRPRQRLSRPPSCVRAEKTASGATFDNRKHGGGGGGPSSLTPLVNLGMPHLSDDRKRATEPTHLSSLPIYLPLAQVFRSC